jgi:hypothetical protein
MIPKNYSRINCPIYKTIERTQRTKVLKNRKRLSKGIMRFLPIFKNITVIIQDLNKAPTDLINSHTG